MVVLLVAGSVNPQIVTRHKRLDAYRVSDYTLLLSCVQRHDAVVVIPNVVAEASNLLGQIDEATAKILRLALREQILHSFESYIPSKAATQRPEYQRLGLTDAALLQCLVLDSSRTLLTADFDLYMGACLNGASAINFNHLRDFPDDPP